MGIRNLREALADADFETVATYAAFAVVLLGPLALPFWLGPPDWLGVIAYFVYARIAFAIFRGLVHPGTWHNFDDIED